MKKVFKALGILLSVLLTILIICATVVGLSGWTFYKKTVEERPISGIVEEIRQRDNYIKIEDVTKTFTDAVVAIEDHRFLEHGGIDILTTTRVLFENIFSMSLDQGGSTITQQLARNFYFTQEKKFTRKVAELFVALDLEKNYSKEEILELYINIIYFGNDQYGVQDAALYYFNKTPAELDLNESTWLAGLPQAPSVYSVDEEKGKQRQQQVAQAMAEYQYISKDEASDISEP